jgi:guanine nucleotide-binding protein subunit alpha
MVDVGGQRSERKKWIHVFDNVQVVLFLVAISGYDHVLVEDRNGNQMHEALMLFESISNSKYFEKSALILFLNKIDLFREKIAGGMSPISKVFPDYTGQANDIEAGMEFFANKFRNLVRQPKKEVYVHYTNATDTDLLKKTMASVQDMIVQRNLNALIL